MSDSLDRFLPEYDEEAERIRFAGLSKDELLDVLIRAHRVVKVLAKDLDEQFERIQRIEAICKEPSKLAQTPGVPSAEDLRRKFEEG